jgi:hypothetical protein
MEASGRADLVAGGAGGKGIHSSRIMAQFDPLRIAYRFARSRPRATLKVMVKG